ncbi:MAG: CPBP family intramembrane metalloprotease [Candidatus Marinimicrobia bacterium]|nr:CPBP family intramembrane metalloprotease [Candidatus Neomarinimicrobiota bacterium]
MPKKASPVHQYLNSSRTIHYSLVITFPVLVIYEIGIFVLFRNAFFEMRNTGEILLRNLFETLHMTNPYVVSGILLACFVAVMWRGYRIEKRSGIRSNYIVYMLLESMLWASILFMAMQLFSQLPLQMGTLEDKISNVNLAVGAGIFEELIFRLVLIGAIIVILERGLSFERTTAVPLSIFLAACVFAGFHLFLEVYQFPVFSQRVFGGLILGTLYYYRGYGISVYTHIIYNILILAGTW